MEARQAAWAASALFQIAAQQMQMQVPDAKRVQVVSSNQSGAPNGLAEQAKSPQQAQAKVAD